MDAILDIASQTGISVVEDAAQAHGARYKGRLAGSCGVAGCFSFYPGKNLGAYGEGGAITTDDDALADAMRVFRDHGQARKYHHSVVGWNARMDGIQGAVLSVKLDHLDAWNSLRREHAGYYRELLTAIPGVHIVETEEWNDHVYHLFAIRVGSRDDVLRRMTETGIGCGIHYPVPVHLTEAYESLGHSRGDFPVSESIADEELSLPMYPELTRSQQSVVVDSLRQVVG